MDLGWATSSVKPTLSKPRAPWVPRARWPSLCHSCWEDGFLPIEVGLPVAGARSDSPGVPSSEGKADPKGAAGDEGMSE